jgi:hypothetical protein
MHLVPPARAAFWDEVIESVVPFIAGCFAGAAAIVSFYFLLRDEE